MSKHDYKYNFRTPANIREAKNRMMILYRDILSIEKQLGDHVRTDSETGAPMNAAQFRAWHSSVRSALVFKRTEYAGLKDWIVERRRLLEAEELNVKNPNDPIEILVVVRTVLRDVLDGVGSEDVGRLYKIIDQHLHHAA